MEPTITDPGVALMKLRNLSLRPLFFSSVLFLSACAFQPGNPWGWIEAEISTAPIRSSGEVALDSSTVHLGEIRLLTPGTAGGEAIADFDPANPPPGYTLCHNGHCHTEDGRIVDYEDIIVPGSSAAEPRAVVVASIEADLHSPASVHREDLKIIEQTSLSQAEVIVERLSLEGVLEDHEDSRPLHITLNLAALTFLAPIQLEVGRDQPEFQELHLRLDWPDELFEGLDFSEALPESGTGAIRVHAGRNRDIYDELVERIALSATLAAETP